MDDAAITRKVEEFWDREVEAEKGCTRPALELTPEMVADYAAGRRAELPGVSLYPHYFLQDVADKDVLCLASGGGQQTAVFGLAGANVTILDLCDGQLQGDRAAAQHYGFQIAAMKGDMRDLARFDDASFDLVYQPISICFAPDVRPVYREVHRVLRPGGAYSVSHCNPATDAAYFEGGPAGWDGVGYRIVDRYRGGAILRNAAGVENMEEGEPIGQHRHLLKDIFGEMIEAGFIIRDVFEDPGHLEEIAGEPGSYEHSLYFLAEYFTIVADKR
jgi:SAM-dependent methyltransferase